MKTMAKYWEERFEEVMRDGRRGQFRQRLEWFLFKLHLAVHAVETQSDGCKLLIFRDGSVYSEESELDAFLPPAGRQKSKAARLVPASNKREHCRRRKQQLWQSG